jgi:hypothetical protein
MTLEWTQANAWGISNDAGADAWNAGRLADALPVGDTAVLAATGTGGLWLLTADAGTPLSNDWDDPDMAALGNGPDGPWHLYAMSSQVLRESRSWTGMDFAAIPAPTGEIFELAGTFGSRTLFVASSDGLFMSAVPGPARAGDYSWTSVSLSPDPILSVTSVSVRATGGSWVTEGRLTLGETALAMPGALSRIALVSRSPVHRDLFWLDADGAIQTAFSHITSGPHSDPWSSYTVLDVSVAHTESNLAAVSRNPDHLDLFWVAPDGSIMSTWWDATVAGGWTAHEFGVTGANAAEASAGVAGVSRNPDQVDVFWMAPDGSLWTSWWNASTSTWSGHAYSIVGPGQVAATSRLIAIAPHADRLDVFWTSPAGSLMHTYWDSSAAVAWPTPTPVSPAGGPAALAVTAVARRTTHLDAFWTAADGSLWTSWRDDADGSGWAGHAYSVAPPDSCGDNTQVSTCSRNGNHLDVLWTDAGGELSTTWWDATEGARLATNLYRPENGQLALCTMISPHEDALCAVARSGEATVDIVTWCADSVEIAIGTQNGKILHGVIGPADASPSLSEAAVTGLPATLDASALSRTSVALSRYTPGAYAVMARSDVPDDSRTPNFLALLTASVDGSSWDGADPPTTVDGDQAVALSVAAGAQGTNYNNCVAVGPLDPTSVVVGWQNGTFGSSDGGFTFDKWMRPERSAGPHLHADVHRIRFDPDDRSGQRILIASDGGVAVTPDAGQTMSSRYNRQLANLQCYTTDGVNRDASGTLGAGGEVVGLMTSGLQDNGNVWSLNAGPWRRFTGGDGGVSVMTRQKQVLSSEGLDGIEVQRSEWDEASQTVTTPVRIPITAGAPGDPSAFLGGGAFAAPVNDPVNQDVFGAKIYAIGYQTNQLFGFWNPTGFTDWRWEFIASLPLNPGESISAAGSANGNVVLATTSNGSFFRVQRAGAAIQSQPNDAFDPNYGVNFLCVIDDDNAFAIYNDWRGGTNGNKILRLTDGLWVEVPRTLMSGGLIPNERCYSIEGDWTVRPQTLFVCTDSAVYVSSNSGESWSDESEGLPTRAHLADFQLVLNPDGTKDLYLSTFGRSVWKASL